MQQEITTLEQQLHGMWGLRIRLKPSSLIQPRIHDPQNTQQRMTLHNKLCKNRNSRLQRRRSGCSKPKMPSTPLYTLHTGWCTTLLLVVACNCPVTWPNPFIPRPPNSEHSKRMHTQHSSRQRLPLCTPRRRCNSRSCTSCKLPSRH